ncbi:response regulator receiver modulated CheB methylesterase [Alkaliphilus metalliredigens QYMF]|uniref:Protein-glutamate methylesterase/protein-glutamine glutaminase n=1 Tax=Alkaliphilus metalliredigens (strain QYMF) TaxID=293826 RepID=A6TRN3_ALKMQ|nr:chemotaxis response regulator protein-glutamate methylesterase [Alkaliphilus metalliredigens]ABR48851.1 response regulator receiver modulated CheB methylesterase [Alkaliphilus metalliredigens QYMF]
MIDKKINVLVVDDSAFMRKMITDILNADPKITVVGSARNGSEVVKKILELKPDVVTLDIEMPICDGIEALRLIMEKCPLPVIMLSSLTSEGGEATISALELGAIDFIQKPTSLFKINGDTLKDEMISKVKEAVKAKITQSNLKEVRAEKTSFLFSQPNTHKINRQKTTLVAIGVSTGGPKALQSVIPYLPANIQASFLVVQHMPAGFTKSLANRLNTLSHINVKEATHLEAVLPGHAYIAPGGYHMAVVEGSNKQLQIHLNQDEPVSGHRPSVDVLFKSVSNLNNKNLIGVIMTGMGSDGTEGVGEIKNQVNSYIIAQDEETSIVYGMPKSAVKTGKVDTIVPLHKIANEIITRVEV